MIIAVNFPIQAIGKRSLKKFRASGLPEFFFFFSGFFFPIA